MTQDTPGCIGGIVIVDVDFDAQQRRHQRDHQHGDLLHDGTGSENDAEANDQAFGGPDEARQ